MKACRDSTTIGRALCFVKKTHLEVPFYTQRASAAVASDNIWPPCETIQGRRYPKWPLNKVFGKRKLGFVTGRKESRRVAES